MLFACLLLVLACCHVEQVGAMLYVNDDPMIVRLYLLTAALWLQFAVHFTDWVIVASTTFSESNTNRNVET